MSPEYSVHFYAWHPNGLAGGSEYLITGPRGFSMVVIDEGLNDMYEGKGMMWTQLPMRGDIEICQTKSPANTKLADPVCHKVTVPFGDPQYSGHFVSEWK